jgi:diadenylate cyclase
MTMEPIRSLLARVPVAIGWWDVVDVVIVAFVVYQALNLLRGTRGVQMAVGVAALVGLYFLSQTAPLRTVNWLVRNLAGYVVFAAIVLFQSDIRRALAQFGRAPFFRYFSRVGPEAAETIDEIVVAATMLASRPLGAIIAIERDIGLRSYVESGIVLDAALTYDLLVSIFQPGSPLHDGAVIVQQQRIAAAACFLPLTTNPRVSRDLGTRHRAAIGLSEESDAAVVVVSEESGRIALAVDGQIERGLTPETLRARLETLLLGQPRTRPAARPGEVSL